MLGLDQAGPGLWALTIHKHYKLESTLKKKSIYDIQQAPKFLLLINFEIFFKDYRVFEFADQQGQS